VPHYCIAGVAQGKPVGILLIADWAHVIIMKIVEMVGSGR
jgi:hypothetical protein